MRKVVYAITAALAVATTAFANDDDVGTVLTVAREFGDVVAATKFCKLPYDQQRLDTFFAEQSANDRRFSGWVQQYHREGLKRQRTMTAADRDRHCEKSRKIIFKLGFLPDSKHLAENLGVLIASERLCGLTFKPEGIRAFIEENVLPDDLEFATQLTKEIGFSHYSDDNITQSEKVARCAQVSRLARHYKFID